MPGPGRPFPKGTSGNPSGRHRNYREVVELARAETEASIRRLVEIRDSDEHIPSSVKAAQVLLDRGWGKAPQVVIVDGDQTTKGQAVRLILGDSPVDADAPSDPH